ncbi:hypothetical protein niasHT_009158 [Heterodera trifolii]|uniref:NADP-dependent oxidoreductase domain-containing protein n=1 Tax=Heterodera trifolii TaxID=157864 RepID=A0ABD2ME32_9BILA
MLIGNEAVQRDKDGKEEEEEESWAKRFPPHRSETEIEQLDEFSLLHQQIVAGRVVPCCVNLPEITEISEIAAQKLNFDRSDGGMPLLDLVKIINSTRQSVAGTAYRVQILFKLRKKDLGKKSEATGSEKSNIQERNYSLSPIYLFKIYRNINETIEINYKEIANFVNVPGGRWCLSTGNFMPKIGLQCSPSWRELEAEQFVLVALEAGIRLFDTSFFVHNRGQISKAIKKFLPLFGLLRTDVFISAKINIVRPENAQDLFRYGPIKKEIDGDQFHSVSDYAHFSVKQCIDQFDGYIDLCLVHYAKDAFKNVSNTCSNNRSDREEVYGVLEHYMDIGTVRSIGVANFDSDHVEHLIKNGIHCVPAVVQCEMHPFLQRDDLLDYCKSAGIFLQAHSIFAYKEQKPSYLKQHQRYLLLKSIASFYKIGTSQLSLWFLMQRAPHVGAVIVEQTDDLYITKNGRPRRVMSCQQLRKLLNGLMSIVCNNSDQIDEADEHYDYDDIPPKSQQQQQLRLLRDEHMRALQRMDLGKSGGGRFTDCEQWKVM